MKIYNLNVIPVLCKSLQGLQRFGNQRKKIIRRRTNTTKELMRKYQPFYQHMPVKQGFLYEYQDY